MRYRSAIAGLGLALSAAMPLAAHAQAQALGGYVGAEMGQSQALKYACEALPTCHNKPFAWKFYSGWQFNRNFAVEVGYTDLGKASSELPGTFEEHIRVKLSEATLVGFMHGSDRASLFGKVGAYYANTSDESTVNGTQQVLKKGNSNLTYGAGVQYFLTRNLALRGEGQRYLKLAGGNFRNGALGASDWSTYTVGLLWKFQ